jgi:alkylation response protein AidB-like acyl-CoA dehydrogenase
VQWPSLEFTDFLQGLIGVSTPAEVGGVGGSFTDEMIVCEEMSYRCPRPFLPPPVLSPPRQ